MSALPSYKGKAGLGETVTGHALVASDGFSARYDLDRIKGIFSRPTHKLVGQSYVGKVLVLDIAKGGVATAWMLHEMVKAGKAPLALLFNSANPVMAQGAAFGEVALIDRFELNITTALKTGDLLKVEPAIATVTVVERR